jgi:DHA1 family chloramphenicol resistance protein-like MFS transporter
VLVSLGTLALAVAPTFAWALVSRVLVGLAGVSPVAFALVGDWYRGSARDQAIARMVALAAIAWVLAAPATALIAQLAGWRMSLVICGLAFLAVAALGLLALPNQPPPRQAGGLSVALGRIWSSHRHRPDLALVLVASALRGASWVGFLTYLSILYRGIFLLETWQLGSVLALGASAYALGSEAAGRLATRFRLRTMLVAALVGSALGGALVPSLSYLPLSLAVYTGFCLLNGVTNAVFSALTLQMAPESRGATMSLSSTLGSVGSALGIAAAGLAIGLLGYSGLGLSVLGFALLSLALVSWPGLWRATKQGGTGAQPVRSG